MSKVKILPLLREINDQLMKNRPKFLIHLRIFPFFGNQGFLVSLPSEKFFSQLILVSCAIVVRFPLTNKNS